MKRKNVILLAIVWLLVMVSVVASAVTLLASGRVSERSRWVSREEYELIERYSRLEEVRTHLVENYYQELDEEELMTGALKGMMASVDDPYTFYYTPTEMEKHRQQSSSEYCGIGLLIQNNSEGYIEIIRVFEEGPADKAGVLPGDLILRVDGTSVQGSSPKTLNDAVSLMKGENGTGVKLTVQRDEKELEFNVVRGEVNASNVSWEMLEDRIGYIGIFQFSGDAVSTFEEALKALQARNAEGLVIDLRNNPGGVLDDVVAIADKMLPEGIIVYTKNREGIREDFYSDAEHTELPLTVLINDMSASAAEIFAAAVQDFERGTVIGEKSYGKGIVQTVIRFENDGAGMQYTSSSYFTPSGTNIHGIGVTPDLIVDDAKEYINNSGIPDLENDVCLQKAVDVLLKEIEGEK